MSEMKSVAVWDVPTRVFHWLNALCVLGLIVVGYIILNGKALEIPRTGTLKLKIIHTWIGYIFAVNLLVRLLWAFVGNRFARWRSFLPGGRGYVRALFSYIRAFFSREPQEYLGHNPVGRLSVTVIFVLIIAMAVSGLVLAGTDLFYPPLGGRMARWVAAPGVDPGTLVANSPKMYDKAAYDKMREFRKPYIQIHLYGYYALLVVVGLHIVGVVISEIRERSATISATFTGRKIISGTPVDAK